MSSIIFGIAFTLVGAFGIFGFIYWGLIPVDKDKTGAVIGFVIGILLSAVFVAAGIWNFTQV